MNVKYLAVALFVLTASAIVYLPTFAGSTGTPSGSQRIAVPPPPPPPLPPEAPKKIQAVFVLDTTGSMSGLIQAAKEKIWSIATTLASAQPAPEIEIGLVAYRDRGDAYVTRVVDLSGDLDSVYATLIDFEAAGGGDGPESVNAALYDAVHRIAWNEDGDTYRVVFLVGDAPAHMDYPNDVPYPESLASAATRGIVVNTIRCGSSAETEVEWRRIAALAQGTYFSVEQSGSAIAIATPFDADLARLSRELDATRLVWGDDTARAEYAEKQSATAKLHALASESARARRAAFNAMASGVKNLFGEHDLVADVSAGRVDLAAVAPESLPAPMQAMPLEARRAHVAEQAGKRERIQAEIEALSAQRDTFLADQAKTTDALAASLDYRLYETVREQAAKIGLEYEDGPRL